MNIIVAWPRLLDPEQAKAYVNSEKIFACLQDKGLVKPRVAGKGLTRYDRVELDAALDAWEGFDE